MLLRIAPRPFEGEERGMRFQDQRSANAGAPSGGALRATDAFFDHLDGAYFQALAMPSRPL